MNRGIGRAASLFVAPFIALSAEFQSPATAQTASEASASGLTAQEVYQQMLPSTCWIRIQWEADGMIHSSWGTGWVYDLDRRLVVTNEHVVHDRDMMDVYFPQYVDGELVHDPAWYVENGTRYRATIIDRDTERDLALVQLDALPEDAVELKLAAKSPEPGERIFALGSLPEGSEGLWIMSTGEVRQVYRRTHANGHYSRVCETQLPTNRGNSGGAVVNNRLEVVAVVEGHMIQARLVSMFIDVQELKGYLDEAVPLVDPATAEEYEVRASRRYDEGRYDQAIADYSAALRIDPQLTSAMLNRGWAFYLKEDYQTAMADFDAALKLDPEMRSAYQGRGSCHRELGDFEKAIRDLTEAIRRDSTDADTFERRAKCFHYLEQYEKALADRNRAVELEPHEFVYLFGRGQTLRELKRFNEAKRVFEQAIALNPQDAKGYYELGYVYFDEEQYPQAALFFGMAYERDPTESAYVNMRGMAHLRQEQHVEAAQDFAAAIQLRPERSLYHWHLALALWNQDDQVPAALESINEYIRLEPDDPDGYDLRADMYDWLEEGEKAAQDRATFERLGGVTNDE
jgi:tetratricopeptide (TPR) repeat protein